MHLEVSALNGKTLDKPIFILHSGLEVWFGNRPNTELLAPGVSIVRDVFLNLPPALKFPDRKLTPEQLNPPIIGQDDTHYNFPFPPKFQTSVVTLKAVYQVTPDRGSKDAKAWTGRVESAAAPYTICWGLKRD